MSPGAVSQALLSLTETPYAVLSLLVQLLQLPVPVVVDDELAKPVRTQPCQFEGGP